MDPVITVFIIVSDWLDRYAAMLATLESLSLPVNTAHGGWFAAHDPGTRVKRKCARAGIDRDELKTEPFPQPTDTLASGALRARVP